MTGSGKVVAPQPEVLVSGKECRCRALIGRAPKILGGRGECSGGSGVGGWEEEEEEEEEGGKMKNKPAWFLQPHYS